MHKYFLGIIALLILGSCNSDDNGSQAITANNLKGKWYLKGGTTNGGAFINYGHDCATLKDYQEFFANGNLAFVGYGSDCEVNDTDSSNWELNGNILTVSNKNFDPMIYEYTYIVEKLTETELILKESYTDGSGTFLNLITLTRN